MGWDKERSQRFAEAVERLWELSRRCQLCPRRCGAQRDRGQVGFCGIGMQAVVSSIRPHFGEERVLVGQGGSGTIFFAGCNLGCVFCQNYDISHLRYGCEMSVEQLVEAMLQLESCGCSNINLVTPSHVAAPIAEAIVQARSRGLSVPIVYNSGGYDSVETLRLLEGIVDIYMPDLKYSDGSVAAELSGARDYPEVSQAAVREMHRQVGDLQLEGGIAKRGLLVRHLVLPQRKAGSFAVIDFLVEQVSARTAINVMEQYRPCYQAGQYGQMARRVYPEEVEEVRAYAQQRGLRLIN